MDRAAQLHPRSRTLRQELHDALVGTVAQYGRALVRFERHRQRRGYDYGCRRLLDEVHLSRSLLFVLADEARAHGRGRRVHAD
jgi:hypothetical protein